MLDKYALRSASVASTAQSFIFLKNEGWKTAEIILTFLASCRKNLISLMMQLIEKWSKLIKLTKTGSTLRWERTAASCDLIYSRRRKVLQRRPERVCTCAMPMEKALGDSRHRSHTSGCGKSFTRTVKSDKQPNTTVSMDPTVLANLGFLNSGVSMKEKKICGTESGYGWEERTFTTNSTKAGIK